MSSTVKTVVFWLVILVSAFLLWLVVKSDGNQQPASEISYSDFLSQVDAGNVVKVTIHQNLVNGVYRDRSAFRVTAPASQEGMLQSLRQKNVEIWFQDAGGGSSGFQLLGTWGPLIVLAALWFFMIRQVQAKRRAEGTNEISRR
jgi:cell division protease FtsH